MKVNVYSIPAEGKQFHFSLKDEWIQHLLKTRMPEVQGKSTQVGIDVNLHRFDKNIQLSGHGQINFLHTCDRCGEKYQQEIDLDFSRHLIPAKGAKRAPENPKDAEVELQEEDLEFGTYEHEEVNLEELVGEEILLAMPMKFLCQENCLGLCPHCGKNLNQGLCQCEKQEDKSPFAVLKNFKVKK